MNHYRVIVFDRDIHTHEMVEWAEKHVVCYSPSTPGDMNVQALYRAVAIMRREMMMTPLRNGMHQQQSGLPGGAIMV
jgi:hypothetical protein